MTPGMDAAFDGCRYVCEIRDIHSQVVCSNAAALYPAVDPEVTETGDHTVGLLCVLLMISCGGYFLLSNAQAICPGNHLIQPEPCQSGSGFCCRCRSFLI